MVNGKVYRLMEDAFPTNSAIGTPYKDYNDAECGEEYDFEMGAKAVDTDGKECMVYWIFQDIKCDEQKDLDDYDYSKADHVEYLQAPVTHARAFLLFFCVLDILGDDNPTCEQF